MTSLLAFMIFTASPSPPAPSCGEACLYVGLNLIGVRYALSAHEGSQGESASLLSLADLASKARHFGANPTPCKVSWEELCTLRTPLIAHLRSRNSQLEQDHYVVVLRCEPNGIAIVDPPMLPRRLSKNRFVDAWTGHVLLLTQVAQPSAWHRCAIIGIATILILTALANIVQRIGRGIGHLGFVVLAVGGILVSAIFGVVMAPSTPMGPLCAIAQADIDLGPVRAPTTEVQIEIRNVGRTPLQINDIRSSCSCIKLKRRPLTIPAGKKDALIFDVNTGAPALSAAQLWIDTNDLTRVHEVFVTWRFMQETVLSQNALRGTLRRGVEFNGTVFLWYPGGAGCMRPKVLRIECSSPEVAARVGDFDDGAHHYTVHGMRRRSVGELPIHFVARPTSCGAPLAANCSLVIEYAGRTQVHVCALQLLYLPRDLTLDRDAILFSNAGTFSSTGQTLVFTDLRRSGPINIANVPDWLDARLDLKPDGQGQIQFKIIKPPPADFVKHIVRLERPDDPEATVPITVFVYAPRD
jgi:hypothetical protein